MIIGGNIYASGDLFGGENCSMFVYDLYNTGEHTTELTAGLIDHMYMTADTNYTLSIDTIEEWSSRTVLKADFNNTIEAGSITANNRQIEFIKFQKRQIDELVWQDVAELKYGVDSSVFYTILDKNILNSATYEYSMLPLVSGVSGLRVLSDPIETDFEGIFLSDKTENFKLLANISYGGITHNIKSNVFDPLNSTYPVVVHSNLDYTTFDVTALFITKNTLGNRGHINIGEERKGRKRLMDFMKNKKPKVYRDENGAFKTVSVVGEPQEVPWEDRKGLATVSFSLVEIGDTDGDTLREYDLLKWE